MFFAHFMATLKLGMERRLQGQTRGQRQGDFDDNFNIDQDLFFLKVAFHLGFIYSPVVNNCCCAWIIILT
jgi:hypothetical protein